MNSDPHDSASWRTFGMLDADETAAFDEAMRQDSELRSAYRDIESISAAVAAVTAIPVVPRAGQLEQLHLRLGLNTPKKTNWPAISGWAAAAVLTFFIVAKPGAVRKSDSLAQVSPPPAKTFSNPSAESHPMEEKVNQQDTGEGTVLRPVVDDGSLSATQQELVVVEEQIETKRLIQEIDVLRGQLKTFEQRDQKRLEPVPGIAWPVIVRMTPPGVPPVPLSALTAPGEEPPLTAILADSLAGNDELASNGQLQINGGSQLMDKGAPAGDGPLVSTAGFGANGPGAARTGEFLATELQPSAMPIYDAARDKGTFFVSNLPVAAIQESYNLWVQNETGGKPIYVGRLPKSGFNAADSYDFSLGSIGMLPTGFILTRDPDDAPLPPGETNTVLQGPR